MAGVTFPLTGPHQNDGLGACKELAPPSGNSVCVCVWGETDTQRLVNQVEHNQVEKTGGGQSS